ncbi:hypothetical protein (mitochondrion) [Capsicum annuum]|uniref:Uncharacterized protein n=2 Tax=Capsicum annuum TaxID=4072 RepID=A0A075VVH9_CAPAN|nr:hypothetical protein [Capsicum annuum]AIG90174.1 hypothetical protein [Capsicum annuum]QFV19663.1 hypothetical protein [Capsicum annuum var. glabriusculum]
MSSLSLQPTLYLLLWLLAQGGVSGQHTKNEVVRSAGVGKRASVQLSLLSEMRYKAPFRSLLCVCWFEIHFFRISSTSQGERLPSQAYHRQSKERTGRKRANQILSLLSPS